MKRLLIIFCCIAALAGCRDEDYSTSKSDLLSFSCDSISMDSVFCGIPVPHKEFWAFNNTDRDLLISEVSLAGGSQNGFRVNVDGTYIGSSSGFRTTNVEVCRGDSMRIYVELTPTATSDLERHISDQINFQLSSGASQSMPLSAHAFKADLLQSPVYSGNDTIGGSTPLIIYGRMTVKEGAELHILPGSVLFFDDEAGIDVRGTLCCHGDSTANVTLRGRRLDNMFSYLPYDRVSGQWQGIHFFPESYNNELAYTDLHSAFNGIVCDSSDVSKPKLAMFSSTVHNCQGYCINSTNSWISLTNCQVSNALNDCLYLDGGVAALEYCTLAQFYPFDADRGVALRYITDRYDMEFFCQNTLITGYSDDELMLEQTDTTRILADRYDHCVLRTEKVENDKRIIATVFENEDSIHGEKHFLKVDLDLQDYDFHIANAESPCINAATPVPDITDTDRDGLRRRKDTPTVGCYEYAQ